ncbi:MAG: DUF5703 domain-containing protein [Kiritimatiellae bacterium]|nr:DUF5703 domain-containing protein [Kiritimatiellia bacterium]
MEKTSRRIVLGMCAAGAMIKGTDLHAADPLDACNVVWDSPSKDQNGSMPVGNGDIGANVWMETNGVLTLLIGKTDAWNANCQLLKIGRLRVTLSPNPFTPGRPFEQTLRLRQGEIGIRCGEGDQAVELRIWVDANRPTIHVEANGQTPFETRVQLDPWRIQRRQLEGRELDSAYGLQGSPRPVYMEPDTVLEGHTNRVVWCHRNEHSIWEDNLRHQGLEGFIEQSRDPLLHRTFGACVEGDGLVGTDAWTLVSARPAQRLAMRVDVLTAQTASVDEWTEALDRLAAESRAVDLDAARAAHRAWWNDFWNRSWIRVTAATGASERAAGDAEAVTRGYTLQRWINACGGRGAFPIKFNGSIFTVAHDVAGKGPDPDYRQWGGPYWWQNTRLAYWPMLAAGDRDLMRPLFRMYLDMLPLAAYRTRTWYGHEGAFLGETVYFWGMYNDNNYGWQREKLPLHMLDNAYIRYEYTASPELLALALDYADYTGDTSFLPEVLLPLADALLPFWDQHYKTNAQGKLVMAPAQALETIRNASNPTPDVAGLQWVLDRLFELPESAAGAKRLAFWKQLRDKIPPIHTKVDEYGRRRVMGHASDVEPARSNVENPELYTVFPFRLYGVGKPDIETGLATFDKRVNKGCNGWFQDDIQAAMLGLTQTAAEFVAKRARAVNPQHRFPAFWGPNFDWVPDQDHGGVLMRAVQAMLLQADHGKIVLFPAWPKDWDVAFKLHAPQQTTVECVYRQGKIESLKIAPPERAKDVIQLEPK